MDHTGDALPPTFPEPPHCPFCNHMVLIHCEPEENPSNEEFRCMDCRVYHSAREQDEYATFRAGVLGRSIFRRTHPRTDSDSDDNPYT